MNARGRERPRRAAGPRDSVVDPGVHGSQVVTVAPALVHHKP